MEGKGRATKGRCGNKKRIGRDGREEREGEGYHMIPQSTADTDLHPEMNAQRKMKCGGMKQSCRLQANAGAG